jgi:hypothetical protein
MCAITTSLAQGRDNPGTARTGVKLALVADKFRLLRLLSHLVPGFSAKSRLLSNTARGLRGRRLGHNMS